MLDIQRIREHPAQVKAAMQAKGYHDTDAVDQLLAVDEQRRAVQTELQEAQQFVNTQSKEIGKLMGQGKKDEAQAIIRETGERKAQIKEGEQRVRELDEQQRTLLLSIPNLPHPSVPVGATPNENETVFTWGEKQTFDFTPKPHWELTEQHGLVDFERGAKVTGAGFPFYIGQGARLQRALVAFFLDLAGDHGYTEMQPPLVINEASGIGTGQLPDKEAMMYEAERDSLFLIPTAEVPVTNFYRDEILDEAALPIKYCAYTPCFRREAGSYGKDVRGLNRLHQFDKVELVHFVHPDRSYDALETLRDDAERALQKLGLPYRRLLMCTGDMGFTQTKKYDLEVWSAGQQQWLEVSSISNFEDYQARRAAVRFRPTEGGKPQYVHTLNGSGLALPRIVAALLEQYQQEDGTVAVPEALRPYTGFQRIGV